MRSLVRFLSVRYILLVLMLVLMTAALAGCGLTTEKSEAAGPDWGRGALVGVANIHNHPALAWDADTKSALLLWPVEEAEAQWRFQAVRISSEGEVSEPRALSLQLRYPTYPKLLRDSQGGLHLFWRDSESEGRPGVFHARLAPDGITVSQPSRVSGTASDVTSFCVAETAGGALDIFWADDSATPAELRHARISLAGEEMVAPHSLSVGAEHPAAAVDTSGTVHLAWHDRAPLGAEQVFYAAFDATSLSLSEPTLLASFPGGTGTTLYPPEIGLDSRFVYVFWSQEMRSGLQAGTAYTRYQAFPIGSPQSHAGTVLGLPGSAEPAYQPAQGAFNYQSLSYGWTFEQIGLEKEEGFGGSSPFYPKAPQHPAPEAAVLVPADYTYMAYPVPGQRDELGLVVSSRMETPRGVKRVQVAFVVLKDGLVKGMEVAGQTRSESTRPIAVADESGSLHLAWVDAGASRTYSVYYASTSPTVRGALSRMTARDILASALGGAWSAAAALSFAPMLLLWLLLPFTWLVVFAIFRPDSDLRRRTGWIGLGVAVALYFASKLFLVPSFLSYAPLLDVVSPPWRNLVYIGVPVLIALLSGLAMRAYIRRSDRQVVLVAFAVFAMTDSLLSLMLYMPGALAT